MALDFNNLKKANLEIVLSDKRCTKLNIFTPNKKILAEIVDVSKTLTNIENDEAGVENIDRLYDICSKAMSRNKQRIQVSREKLEAIFDIEDLILFLQAYIEFVTEIQDSKNLKSRTIH